MPHPCSTFLSNTSTTSESPPSVRSCFRNSRKTAAAPRGRLRGSTTELCFSVLDHFKPSAAPCETTVIPVNEWRQSWRRRLRPYLLPANVREVYRSAASDTTSLRFGDIARSESATSAAPTTSSTSGRPKRRREHPGPASPSDRTKQPGTAGRRSDRSDRRRVARCDEPMMLLRIPKDAELRAVFRSIWTPTEGDRCVADTSAECVPLGTRFPTCRCPTSS